MQQLHFDLKMQGTSAASTDLPGILASSIRISQLEIQLQIMLFLFWGKVDSVIQRCSRTFTDLRFSLALVWIYLQFMDLKHSNPRQGQQGSPRDPKICWMDTVGKDCHTSRILIEKDFVFQEKKNKKNQWGGLFLFVVVVFCCLFCLFVCLWAFFGGGQGA